MNYIIIPQQYQNLFPISISCYRVELMDSTNGDKVIPENCVVWREMLDAFDKDLERKAALMPLYEYVLNSDAVSVELKKEIMENL